MPATPFATGMLDDRLALFIRTHHRTMHRYFQSVGMFNGHPHMLFHIAHSPGITQKALAERLARQCEDLKLCNTEEICQWMQTPIQ